MLAGMRKAAQPWLGKAVLTLMFSFLILSFAVWGIGDIFRGFGEGKVANVGGTEISAEEFRYEFLLHPQQLFLEAEFEAEDAGAQQEASLAASSGLPPNKSASAIVR